MILPGRALWILADDRGDGYVMIEPRAQVRFHIRLVDGGTVERFGFDDRAFDHFAIKIGITGTLEMRNGDDLGDRRNHVATEGRGRGRAVQMLDLLEPMHVEPDGELVVVARNIDSRAHRFGALAMGVGEMDYGRPIQ